MAGSEQDQGSASDRNGTRDSGSGALVSAAFPVPIGAPNDVLRDALTAIDAVHSDGPLPRTLIVRRLLPPGQRGYYDPERDEIVIGQFAPDPPLTLLHEVGHVIDEHGFGLEGRLASISDDRFDQWRAAVTKTVAAFELGRLADRSVQPGLREHFEYLGQIDELWARSYTQHIVDRSARPLLTSMLDRRLERCAGRLFIPYYWDEDDFRSVAEAIDNLWRRLGWNR